MSQQCAVGSLPPVPKYRTGGASGSVQSTPIALRRLKHGVSLRGLSKLTGISRDHLGRLFNGHRNLTLRIAKKIAVALNLPLAEVVEAEGLETELTYE